MAKKTKFFKKNTVFSFQQSFFCPIRENFVYFISETANGLRLYKTLTIIYKTKAFSQKKRIKYSYKAHFKQNIGGLSYFFLYFQVFFSFLQFNSQNLETNFVSYQKNLCFFLFFVKKIELLRLVSRETSDVLLSNIPRILFHVKQQQNPNTSRE